MIKADKSGWYDALFFRYNMHYLLRRHFHAIRLKGALDPNGPIDPHAPINPNDPKPGSGVLYVMNHSSWWDGLLAYHAFRMCSRGDHYLMMDEKQMRDYRFFRKMGAFSIDKATPRGIAESLRYAVGLLREGKCVWLYPQGEICHLEQRPLALQPGAAHLLRQCPQTRVVPVTVYYDLQHHQKTEVTIWAGDPLAGAWETWQRQALTGHLETALTAQLDRHRHQLISNQFAKDERVHELLPAGRSVNETFVGMKKRVKGWKSFFGR